MSIYQCPNCGMTRSGNQAMGSVLPQCQCAWQFSPPVTPQRTWVGLTEDEVSEIIDAEIGFNSCWGPEEAFARAIEAKLKEKNK